MTRTTASTATLFALLASCTAYAQVQLDVVVTDAYDGDTLSVHADIWPNLVWQGSVRIKGVDAAEIRGQCEQEKALAVQARDYVRSLLIDRTVRLTGIENDLYAGRVLASVHFEEAGNPELVDLTQHLIDYRYAREYDGGTREGWCGDDVPMPVVPPETQDPDDSGHPLNLYDDNNDGRISCTEARRHNIAPVRSDHPAYVYMNDADGDGVVCE